MTATQKTARRLKQDAWREENKERHAATRRAWALTHPDKVKATHDERRHKRAFSSILTRCKKHGFPVPDFTAEWLLERLLEIGHRCECCQRQMAMVGQTDSVWTVDRVDNDLPYVKTNVALICMHCNRVTNTGSAEDHERIAAWMRSRGVK